MVKDQTLDEIGINAAGIHALWTLKGLNALDNNTIEIALKHPSSDMRKNAIKAMDFNAASVDLILKYDLLNDPEKLVVMNALLLMSKSPLNEIAENRILSRLNNANETDDRWLPDAFSCVLTANNSKLLKKQLALELIKKTDDKNEIAKMNHDHHTMGSKETKNTGIKTEGTDLVVSDIKISPSNPAVRERIYVTVEVTNIGKQDIAKDVFIPLNIRFEGMGMKIDQVSRNFKDGIKSGETVSITKNINGPWVGNISFATDIVGTYNLSVGIDRNNEIIESNKKNNEFNKKIEFMMPASLKAFAIERAIRSYASVATADSLASLLKKSASLDVNSYESVVKAISEGWNYKSTDTKLNPTNKAYLTSISKKKDERLEKLLTAWNIIAAPKPSTDVKTITIKTIKEAMKYDIKSFTVKAGQTVEIIFENVDAMQHNMVITKPNMLSKVGQAGDKMMKDPKGAEKNYVPSIPEVLFSTPLINPGKSYKLTFKAPASTGDYPYVCTFPGHWTLMNGIMKVIPK
jgi:azurin